MGEKGDAETDAMLAALHGTYQPNKIVALSESTDGQTLPLLTGKIQVDNTATAYVCENYACQAPTTDVEVFVKLLR